ncbi:lipid-transfer protein [Nonomuraea roseoviolacea]|uniref:Acetyl-CoA acetyltransferase n=1 Tax=Nonomuraea roseoviolacea subsp. carminata TaxID=160689 RepID=A0ABT1JY82_9ACTN|nr:lipid-transfer protein [Nonomuraea roseoviolacea]MCP2345739.1 acetyl-CoA acetyltransferase [Nonomuraea roseoviolacea subsp. carminata]
MRDVAIVAFAQTRHTGHDTGVSEPELILPVIEEVKERTGLRRFGFTCSGSCDYLAGAPFSFVSALDALGAWPPISESHVEMDGAWALYEAWVRLQHGDVDTALVYGFGKSSLGDLRSIMTLQLDPYYLAPLGLDQVSFAALQAAAVRADRAELDAIVRRSRAAGRDNPYALDLPDELTDDGVVAPLRASDLAPLRASDVAPITDGAAAVVLAAGDAVAELCARPAHITGIAHRVEPHYLGMRDLARSVSAADAARAAGVGKGPVEVAELHTQFAHEEIVLRRALELPADTVVNPSGGPLAANPVMAAGLIRIGEAARRIHDGTASRTVGHAAGGPCLQHNLVTVLEA